MTGRRSAAIVASIATEPAAAAGSPSAGALCRARVDLLVSAVLWAMSHADRPDGAVDRAVAHAGPCWAASGS